MTEDKPAIICESNNYIAGIDASDLMLYSYFDEQRTVKYWNKVHSIIFLGCY